MTYDLSTYYSTCALTYSLLSSLAGTTPPSPKNPGMLALFTATPPLTFITLVLVLLLGFQHPSGIVGGRPVLKYPFLVGIEESGSFICGGSLIAPQHILTAANFLHRRRRAGEDERPFPKAPRHTSESVKTK